MLRDMLKKQFVKTEATIFKTAILITSTLPLHAFAVDLVLQCKLNAVGGQGVTGAFERRIEIVMEPRYFKAYRKDGSDYLPDGDGFPELISTSNIVLTAGDMISESYNRITGEYLYRNIPAGREVTGRCEKLVDKTKDD